ncbi:MAG: translocation/assembly module TamB domain-containing protein [Gemmatimonadota bacterium]|nr:translocation/assembly module TamB domain-containing protein [Gemmatimonadota bacterium]
MAVLTRVIVATGILLAAGVTAALAISRTATGRELALDWALGKLRPEINGTIHIGSIGPGGILGGATLVDVELTDDRGRPVLVADSLRARYSVAELVVGSPAIADLHIWGPVVNFEPAPGERLDLAALLARRVTDDEPPAASLPDQPTDPALVVRGARIHGGTVILRDDAGREANVERIDVELAQVDFRPGRERSFAAEVERADLSFPVGTGRLELAAISGALEAGDEGISLNADRFRLPGSVGSGSLSYVGGAVGAEYVFDLQFEQLSLVDLHWVRGRFEEETARGGARIAVDRRGVHIDVDGGVVEAESGRLAIDGGVSLGDSVRFRGLRVAPEALTTAEVEQWLSVDVPVPGRLEGDIGIDGVPGRLSIDGAVAMLRDGTSDTVAVVSGGGTILESWGLEGVALEVDALDYEVLTAFFPAIPWTGRGGMSLEASGELRSGIEINAAADHTLNADTRSAVSVAGTLYGDTAISVVDLEATLAPLALSLVREFDPDFPLTGDVEGTVSVAGNLDELDVLASLRTSAGAMDLRGVVNARDPAAGYRLTASAEALRLSELLAGLPDSTVVSGAASLDGRGLDFASLRGALVLEVGPSTVGALRLDSLGVNIWADDDGLLHVESLFADAGGLLVRGRGGSLGLVSDVEGDGVILSLSSPSIRPLRPLFMGEGMVAWDELTTVEQDVMIEFDGVDPDTFPLAREIRFDGRVLGEIRLAGAIGDLSARTTATIESLEYGVNSARTVRADFTAEGLNVSPAWITPRLSPEAPARPPPQLLLDGTITGNSILLDNRALDSARVTATYALGAGGRLHAYVARSDSESYEAQAVLRLDDGGGRLDLDRLTLVLPDRRWGLMGPASFEWDDAALTVNDFGLIRPGADGLRMYADGRLALEGGDSDFELDVANLDLSVVGGLLQMTEPPTGIVSADVRASGPGPDPEWAGWLRVANVAYGAVGFDTVAASGRYADGSLTLELDSWVREGRGLHVNGSVPLDLRLLAVEDRIPDRDVDLDIVVDSFPAGMVLGVIKGVEDLGGHLSGNVRLRGTRSDFEPAGTLLLADGTGLVAPLGVRLTDVDIGMQLSTDGTVVVDGSAVSGGTMEVRGEVNAGRLSDVQLDLAFWAREFQSIDRRDMEAAMSGDSITLTGAYNAPFVEGSITVTDGTVFIEEFQRAAQVIDLYDPVLFSAATAPIGSTDQNEDPSAGTVRARNQFMENLRVLIDVQIGRGNWLRSRELNVETAGDLSLTFDRQGNQLALQGEMEVVRGTYNLGPRTLRITEGGFQFVGTPGFNPGVSITAEDRLRTREGEPLVITADISGTLLSPVPTLSSDSEIAMSEADLVNYLFLGRPTSAFIDDGMTASVGAGSNLLWGQVANQIGYLLARELEVDHLSVSQAEQSQASAAFGASSLQVEVGWYLLDDVFFTGVYQRGFCADPTLPVSSGGVRVEVGMPKDVTLEGFYEGRCTRERYRGLGDLSLELARIWGFSFFREWGY